MGFRRTFAGTLRRPAFTLVELLVVVGIISLLVAVLLPVLARVRRQVDLLTCSNNLRQIVQAAHLYGADNRGRVPRDPAGGAPKAALAFALYLGASKAWVWSGTGNPYHEEARYFLALPVFQCPALPETNFVGLNDGYEVPTNREPKPPIHYAMHSVDFAGYRNTGEYSVPHGRLFHRSFPPNTVYATEMPHNIYMAAWRGVVYSGGWGIYHPGQMTFDDTGVANPTPNMVWSNDRHHRGKTPLGFWDGHVEVRNITPRELPVQLLNPYHPLNDP